MLFASSILMTILHISWLRAYKTSIEGLGPLSSKLVSSQDDQWDLLEEKATHSGANSIWCSKGHLASLQHVGYHREMINMANWFEEHPARSIVTYTLVVVGATWATSTFILQDNRLSLAKSELESQKTLAEQYKAKSELLQKDLESLRSENQEYKNWLSQSKDAIPIMVPQLVELKKQIARLNALPGSEGDVKAQPSQSSVASAAQAASLPSIGKGKPKLLPQTFTQSRTARLGTAAIDETTGTVVTVKQTFPDRTATLLLNFPDRAQILEERVFAGKQFKFTWGGRSIAMTVIEIQFFGDTVSFRMQPTDV
jgi:hypothetical protein